MQPDVMAVLPFFDPEAAWAHFDAACRAQPACEHNQAWREQGPGRGFPPDCAENRPWRAEIAAGGRASRMAQDNAREAITAA